MLYGGKCNLLRVDRFMHLYHGTSEEVLEDQDDPVYGHFLHQERHQPSPL